MLAADHQQEGRLLGNCQTQEGVLHNQRGTSVVVGHINNHFHVIVSPNAKDTLQVKDAGCKTVSVCKVLSQVGLGMIFSDIICDNQTIKSKVREHAFRYIVSSLGCLCRFTDSYKQMCGCTKCVGLYILHPSLQAKCGVMHCQFAIDAQHCTRKAQATEKTRGWGVVTLEPTPMSAIMVGRCAMEFACCVTLGVPDAPVHQLQGVPSSE